jgi:undecaprenyl-diphosphatase
MGSIPQHVRLWPCTIVQLAASFVNRVTPASIGGMVLNGRFLEKSGADRGTAVAAVGLNSLAGGIVHLVLIVGFFVWSENQLGPISLPSSSLLLVAVAVLLAVIGLVLWSRWGRRRLLRPVLDGVRSALISLRELAQNPAKLSMLFGGSAIVTSAYILAFHLAIIAVGGDISLAQSGTVYLAANALASPSPTPGNLGAIEAALVAALTSVGLSGAIAVSSVLAFRLATYWLPVLPGWLSWQVIQRRGYV